MAFEAAMKMMGGKKPSPKGSPKPVDKGETKGGDTTTITHHPDGSHSIDGEHHPSHLHMLAALGHKITGGDKHHIAHHDGAMIHTHGIHETGEHAEGGSHNSAEEAKEAMGNFFDEESQEPAHQHGPEERESPSMGAYGG